MKRSIHIPADSIEKQHYKRSFIQRKYNEQDADKEIEEYRHDKASTNREFNKRQEVQETPRLD